MVHLLCTYHQYDMKWLYQTSPRTADYNNTRKDLCEFQGPNILNAFFVDYGVKRVAGFKPRTRVGRKFKVSFSFFLSHASQLLYPHPRLHFQLARKFSATFIRTWPIFYPEGRSQISPDNNTSLLQPFPNSTPLLPRTVHYHPATSDRSEMKAPRLLALGNTEIGIFCRRNSLATSKLVGSFVLSDFLTILRLTWCILSSSTTKVIIPVVERKRHDLFL